MSPPTILIDVANLTIHRRDFIRTGIQEVVYRVAQNVVALRDEFKASNWMLLPQIPRSLVPYFENPAEVLSAVEKELGLPSKEVWGFDLASRGYRMSDEEILGLVSESDVFHAQSLVNVRPFAGKTTLSMTVYDLGPVYFPEYVNEQVVSWFNSEYLPSAGRHLRQAVCISENTAFDLREHEATRSIPSIRVLPLGFDLAARSEGEIPGGEYVIYLGSLEPRKNFEALLEGFEAHRQRDSNSRMKLVLVGSTGWKNSELESRIAKSAFSDDILRAGYLPDERLRAHLEGAVALGLLSHYEGFGLPAAQAASLGIPVITHIGSSLPEAAGELGIYVDPNDSVSVAAGIALARDRRSRGEPRRGIEQRTWKQYTRELMGMLLETAERAEK